MAEIDSLSISISASAQVANKAIDSLIDSVSKLQNAIKLDTSSISNIAKSVDLSGVTNQAKNVQSEMKNISNAAKTIVKPVEEARKSAADLAKDLNTKFKDFTPVIDFTQTESSLTKLADKYKQQMTTAQNEINRILASSTADKQAAGIERWTIKLKEAENGVKAIEEHMQSLSRQSSDVSMMQFPSLDEVEPKLQEIRNTAEEVREVMSTNFSYDKGAMQAVFGDSVKDIQDYGQAIEQFGQTAWLSLNNANVAIKDFTTESKQTLQDFANELSKYSDIIDMGGQETETGLQFPIRGLEMSLEQLRAMYPEAKDLIDSYEAEIERAKSLSVDVPTFQYGNIDLSQFEQIKTVTSGISEDLKQFGANLAQLEVPEIREENLDKLRNSLDKTEQKLEELRVKLANGLTMGRITENVDDRTFRNLQEQIALTEKQAEALRAKISEVGSQPISDTTNFDSMATSMKNVSVSGKQFLSVFDGINRTLRKLGSAAGSAISAIGKLTKSMLLLNTATKKSSGAFNLNFKTILKYAFGIRSTFVLVNRLRSAIKDGMKNLVQYSDETNKSVSMLQSSLATLKNASAAAASPLLNAIAPALNNLIQLFIKATNAVNQFMSALLGRSTWIKAKDVVTNYADSISDAVNAAKGALQPFDKLNNLTSQQAAGGGGMDASDMFETLPVESKFKDLVDWLKKMWDAADFYDLGKKLGESLKKGLDSIPWTKIRQIARKIGKSLASLINGFIEVEGLGYSIGRTLAEAINTAYEFLNGFVHELHWESVGKFIADTLNGFFENIDWELIRYTIVTGFKGIADAINAFVYGFNWDNVSNTISNVINIIAESVHTFFSTVDWEALGTNLGEQLMETIRKIDWMEVGRALGSIIQSAIDFVKSFIKQLDLSDITKAFMDLLKGFFEEADAGDVATAIMAVIGIKLGVAVGKFAFDSIVESIFGGIAKAATPSLAESAGTSIMSSLGSVMGDLAAGVGGFVAFDTIIKNPLFDLMGKITGDAEKADVMREKYGKLGGTIDIVKDTFSVFKNSLQGYGAVVSDASELSKALEIAMQQIADGAILSDEHMAQLQERFGATNDDLEMLRQEMLDANPQLRELADNFGLFDSSAETLKQISAGMELIEQGIYDADDAVTNFKGSFPTMTDEAKAFFESFSDGVIPLGQSLDDVSASMEEFSASISEATDGAVNSFSQTAESMASVSEKMISVATETGEHIGSGLTRGMESVDTEGAATGFFDKLVASIKSVFGIHSPADSMIPFGENILLGVVEGFKSKFDAFTAPIQQLVTQISSQFTNGLQAIKNLWQNAWNSFPSVVTNILSNISSTVNNFMSKLSSAFSGLGSRISGAVSSATRKFRTISIEVPSGMPVIPVPNYSGSSILESTNSSGIATLSNSISGINNQLSGYAINTAVPYSASQYSASSISAIASQSSGSASNSKDNITADLASFIMRSHSEEMVLMREQNQLLRGILEKEFGISTDEIGRAAQDYARDYSKRTGRLAYDF